MGEKIPPYIILSHTWGDDEVSYEDMTGHDPIYNSKKRKGFSKIEKSCALAKADGWAYIWIDTCCIDQKSSAELSEAINSMYQWYMDAVSCFAFLEDVSVLKAQSDVDGKSFSESRWFTRGWTLQELLAPEDVIFYDKDWIEIGTKNSLADQVGQATGIDIEYLSEPARACVATKMSWISLRETTRPEDMAYCMLGLFGVNMPLLYGEGGLKAFKRLQYEILRSLKDETIFAWKNNRFPGTHRTSLIADRPRRFAWSKDIVPIELPTPNRHSSRTNTIDSFRLAIGLSWRKVGCHNGVPQGSEWLDHSGIYIAPLACARKAAPNRPFLLRLSCSSDRQTKRLMTQKFEFF